MKIAAIVFDIDGTLFPNLSMYTHSLPFFLRNVSFIRHFSVVRKEVRKIRPIDDLLTLEAQLLSRRNGKPVQECKLFIQDKIYSEWSKIFSKVRLFPNCRETIQKIRKAGFKTAVLSDLPVQPKLQYLGIESLWDAVCTSEESQYLKPNPEPFLLVCSRLNLAPAEILYVGNSYRYDILGAKNAGMRAAHLCKNAKPDSKSDFSFYCYKDLWNYIQKINQEST